MNDIAAAFHEYFEIVTADTPELRKEAFSLRYRILCVKECIPGFETEKYPDELERDEYDDHSIHLLLKHKASDSFIGTARLILSDISSKNGKFPVELHTQFYPMYSNMSVDRQHTVEISRFAILSDFFRRKDDLNLTVGKVARQPNMSGRRRFPHPMLGLAVGIIQMCAKHNIYYWFSAMDPALNRLLGFYGMQLNPIGPLAEFHGTRRPYHVCILDVLERMYQDHRDIWELVTENGQIWPADLNSIHLSQPRARNDSSAVTC
ncbi:MAG: PEP-CTERM/exosortase system-associated acyltransferase [Nitrosomonas sp.]|nr:PEP-CTERM/exosortase system-associated acyltransferase [Nitrosomonas sp.]